MIKRNKGTLILTTVIILIPILVGLMLWQQLPEEIPTHWNADGEADGWSSKAFAVFVPSIFMLACHWGCVFVTFSDPKNKTQNKIARTLVLWTIPFVSLFSSAMIYGTALKAELNLVSSTFAIIGIMFMLIGNYLPKITQNYTIGVKVPWALASEANWNATHRFAGKIYVIGGLILLLTAFLPTELTIEFMIIILLIMGLVPILYSYLYYRKSKKGTA